nr:unnamed protein product [Callosobruchus chinensis]
MYSSRIHVSTIIRRIIPEVCTALIDALRSLYLQVSSVLL